MESFLADTSPDAVIRTVDRLLNSPQYGERWGRHWMDIWRYSDAWGLGEEVRNSHKHMWHWRDWIIESINSDKGYDQMILEMLAADEIYPNDLKRLRATGYLARQYFKFNRSTWMDETIEHTSKAMLGLHGTAPNVMITNTIRFRRPITIRCELSLNHTRFASK